MGKETSIHTPAPQHILDYVAKWANKDRGCNHYEKVDGQGYLWSNKTEEFHLLLNPIRQDWMLSGWEKTGKREVLLFFIPVGQTEGYFTTLIKMIGF